MSTKIGSNSRELRATAHGPRRDLCAGRELVERGTDEHVVRAPALGEGRNRQAVSGLGGEVLGGVHGQVRPPVEYRTLHLLDEDTLATDRVQGDVLAGVAGGLDEDEFDGAATVGRNRLADDVRLCECLT